MRVLSLCLVCLLAACSLSDRRPEHLVDHLPPAPTEGAAELGAEPGYTADLDWWTAYNDEALNALAQTALANNLDLAQSAININRALYQAKLIGADLVPAFSGDLSGSASRFINEDAVPSNRSVSGGLEVGYELDLWRRLADRASAAEWEYSATVEDLAATRLALVNNVVATYFNLSYLDEADRVMEQTIDNYRRILDIASARFAGGKSAAVEPAQARQSLLAAENSRLDLRVRRNTAEQTLRLLLNLTPMEQPDIRYTSLLDIRMPGVDLDVPLAVLGNRPDLRAAEERLQAAFKDLRAMEKSWYPGVTLGATLSSSDRYARTAFDFPILGGLIRISLPFLDWNRVYWNVKLSEADFDAVRLRFIQAVTTALNEVDTARFAYEQARATVANTDEKYRYDQEITRYYQQRWDLGAGELRDLLEAMNTEASSRLALLSSRYDQIRYENLLYKALAGKYARTP
jgi:NodT family efflux transporter outer membrane factor (OMF) lipoprotein